MGWAGGYEVFDAVAKEVFKPKMDQKAILKALMSAFEDQDWDTQWEGEFFEHPLVQEIYAELNPDDDEY